MKLTARLGGYSSIVGQSILLQTPSGMVACQLAMLNVGHTLEESHAERCQKFGEFVVDKINGSPARWVDTRERHPTVGGTYFTGQWYGPMNGLRHFRIKRLYFIIHKDNQPQWYSFEKTKWGSQKPAFPKCWLEGMPAPPPDDQA